jgi:hypothetical protein
MSYFFHQNPVRDMLIAQRRLREVEAELETMDRELAKKKVDREQLKTYIRNHKQIR